MKKLYRKGTVHPSPSPSSPSSSSSFSLSFLPAAILTLAASLSVDDKQVLAYLLSCPPTTPFDSHPSKSSSSNKKHLKTSIHDNTHHHPNCFSCYCFTCYTSYWSRWDSSPNRQLIHEIIDAFEDHLLEQNKTKKKQGVNRRSDKKKNVNARLHVNSQGSGRANPESNTARSVEEDRHGDEAGDKQGSVRKMVTFLWQNVWG
ncbi:uncharacterized protein LOC141591386 [Silene latifolia]|uniref:uncharacterized protein LOC141591386 n=1 Tax=Silene latifolia TaxID=37657 RepID=UPI003D76C72F